MSVIKEVTLICDGCGATPAKHRQSTAKEIRSKMVPYGWKQDGKKDFCKTCAVGEKNAKPARKGMTLQQRHRLTDRLIARDGLSCGICNGQLKRHEDHHIDHITPLSRGGSDEISNLQLTHSYCNMKKGNR